MSAFEKEVLLAIQNEEFICLRAGSWTHLSQYEWSRLVREGKTGSLTQKIGICWNLQHAGHNEHCVGMREAHPPKLLDRQPQSQHLHRSWGLVSFWLSCICQSWVSVFRSRCRASSWPWRPTTHNPTRAGNRCKDPFESWESKTRFFSQFPFCVRSPVGVQLRSVCCVVELDIIDKLSYKSSCQHLSAL